MAYYSDFSYLSRATMLTYLWFYLVFHIWRSDRFASLAFARLRRFELKSVVTLMLLTFIPVQLYYDISISCILYSEGFVNLGPNLTIMAKPFVLWSNYNQDLAQSIDYVLMIGFSFQTGTLFLLQSFWNYLAGSVAKHSFMGSMEFKFYIVWTLCTITLFPFLKFSFFIFEQDLANLVPELVYGFSLFILACLGVLSHFRFRKLIFLIKDDRNGSATTGKLVYFSRINDFMTLALFITSISFIIIAADGISPLKPIDLSKPAADFLIFNASFCTMAIWFLVIKIVHCPYQLGVTSSFSVDYSVVPRQLRPSTVFTMSETYGSTIHMEPSDSSAHPSSPRCSSRHFAFPPLTNYEYDQSAPPAPPISPIQRVPNPRHSVIKPIQRPVSFRQFQDGHGHVEDPQRPTSFHQYPVSFRRPSKPTEGQASFI